MVLSAADRFEDSFPRGKRIVYYQTCVPINIYTMKDMKIMVKYGIWHEFIDIERYNYIIDRVHATEMNSRTDT